MSSAYASFTRNGGITMTPQSMAIPGREADMARNAAGGVGFAIDKWERLERFLITGSESGTYYVGATKLTAENAQNVIACIAENGIRVLDMARDINVHNRAPKVDQQLFVLALALQHGDDTTKQYVAATAPAMLRTGTHLLHFVDMIDGLGGWNRSKRRIVAAWFESPSNVDLAYQVLKYQRRDGWSMRDVLRVAHPKTTDGRRKLLFDWICRRPCEEPGALPLIIAGFERMKTLPNPLAQALYGIECGLPREALPTEALNEPDVWLQMLPKMPLHALLRNLGNMTARGIFDQFAAGVETNGDPFYAPALATAKLTDREQIIKSRVHPFAILLAAMVYRTGHSIKGATGWNPSSAIMGALEDAWDLAFANIAPTNKRVLVGIDGSGSMTQPVAGSVGVSAREAAGAMAVTLGRMEPHFTTVAFGTQVKGIVPITKRTGIVSLLIPDCGGTDLSAPLRWALGDNDDAGDTGKLMRYMRGQTPAEMTARAQVFDAFIILTDDETWAGDAHPSEVLKMYRRHVNPKAKLINCSLSSNRTSIVDPTDPLSMGCSGLDANLPALVTDFLSR